MKDIKICLEKQIEVSKELNHILTTLDELEEKERELLCEQNEELLKKINNSTKDNVVNTNDRLMKLQDRVNLLLNNENTKKDPNFHEYLLKFNNELSTLQYRVKYLEDNLTNMNEKHSNYVHNIVGKEINHSNIPNSQKIRQSQKTYNKAEQNLEFKLGSNILNIIGVILILIAFITFGSYVYSNYLNETLKGIFLFVIAGITIILGEKVFNKKVPKFATGISALGVGGLYASLIINYLILDTINSVVAIILTLLITGISILISKSNNSNVIRVIALIGGYGSLFPMNSLNGFQSYITVIMLLLISVANVCVPLNNKKFSIYSSILNMFFAILMSSSYLIDDIPKILYLIGTLGLNNFMYIKSFKDENNYKLSALLTSLALILMSATMGYELVVGLSYLIISIICYVLSTKELKNIYYIHIVSILISLNIAYSYEVGIFYSVIYSAILLSTVYLWLINKDKYLKNTSIFIIGFGLFHLIAVENILDAIIYTLSFGFIIWKVSIDNKEDKLSVLLKHLLFGVVSYIIIVNSGLDVELGVKIISVLAILYILALNNIELLKDNNVKKANKIILITVFILINLIWVGLLNLLINLAVGTGVLLLLTNSNYVESKFLEKHKFLLYSIYLTYGVTMLFEVSNIESDISNILISVLLMIIAFANVWIGFKLNDLELRKYGLILSLIVCAKLIFVDFYLFNFIIKTILFLIVGIVALIISYVYSKLEQELKTKEVNKDIENKNN